MRMTVPGLTNSRPMDGAPVPNRDREGREVTCRGRGGATGTMGGTVKSTSRLLILSSCIPASPCGAKVGLPLSEPDVEFRNLIGA